MKSNNIEVRKFWPEDCSAIFSRLASHPKAILYLNRARFLPMMPHSLAHSLTPRPEVSQSAASFNAPSFQISAETMQWEFLLNPRLDFQ